MNDRFLARTLLLRTAAATEFLILLTAVIVIATAAGIGSTAANIAENPLSARLVNRVPEIIFAALVFVSPLALVRLTAADHAAGWTAPVFAGGGSAVTYTLAMTASVALAGIAMLGGTMLAFHLGAGSLGLHVIARLLTGALSLITVCAYAAVLWVLLSDPDYVLLAMIVLWLGPLGLGFYLLITYDLMSVPLWVRLLTLLVPPVRLSTALAVFLLQAAYAVFFAALLVMLSPRRVPVWR